MKPESHPSAGATGHRQRLRDRYLAGDPNAYTDEALLELLLTYAIPQQDVRPIATRLLERFGSLGGVLSADPSSLMAVAGVKAGTSVLLKVIDWIRAHYSAEALDERRKTYVPDSQLPLFDVLTMSALYNPAEEPEQAHVPARRKRVSRPIAPTVPAGFVPVLTPNEVPRDALQFGFSNGPTSPHSSRTMMLAELRALLAPCPPSASQDDYRTAVVEDNVLLKPTATTRSKSFVRLRELYALDRRVVLFRALRELWDDDAEAQPLIALLCAAARDVILRSTAETILATPVGTTVTWQMLELVISQHFPDRYNHTTLAAMAQHTLSSWRQSGHLGGEAKKVRAAAACRPTAAAYALLLGHLCGARGDGLFDTLWARLLDAPMHVVHEQARAASQRGWLEYRKAGNVTEITFRHLLRQERQAVTSE